MGSFGEVPLQISHDMTHIREFIIDVNTINQFIGDFGMMNINFIVTKLMMNGSLGVYFDTSIFILYAITQVSQHL